MSDKFIYQVDENSEFLEHGKFGEAMKNHLYTAREWVNGKWQYTYGNAKKAGQKIGHKIDNALGADEKQRRDAYKNAYQTAKYQEGVALKKAKNDANSYRNAPEQQKDMAKYYRDKSSEAYTKAVAKSGKIGNAAKKASDEYDRTVYGKIDQAKEAIGKAKSSISEKIGKGKKKINRLLTKIKNRKNPTTSASVSNRVGNAAGTGSSSGKSSSTGNAIRKKYT